jgi:vacuolar-type H+-ATPase subunit I/STV1
MESFRNFSRKEGKLDEFLHENMAETGELWAVVQKLLLLSHGQASVERGFSVNKQLSIDNMHERTVVAQRMVCDHIKSVGGVTKVKLTKELMISVSSARQKYVDYLEQQKKDQAKEAQSRKRKQLDEEIEQLKVKRRQLELTENALLKDADEFALKAQAAHDFTLLAKSNSHRNHSKEIRGEIDKINESLKEKQEKANF